MKTKITIPATKSGGNEIVLEVGKWYTTFTTDMRNEYSYLFKVDEIGDNDRVYYTTFTGKQRSSSGTKRTQFTKNAELLDSRSKRRIINLAFTMNLNYFYQ